MSFLGTQSLLDLVKWCAIGATVGGSCYGFSKAANVDTPGCAGIIGAIGALFTGVFLSYPVLVAALFCVPGAFAEKALSRQPMSAFGHYLDLWFTTCLCIVIGFATTSIIGVNAMPWKMMVSFFVGLISTPSAIPLLRWMWRNSRTRPGFDRHFNSSDELSNR